MNRGRKISLIIVIAITCIIGYFILLPFDYKVSFKTNNAPWLVYHFIKLNHETQFISHEGNKLSFESHPKNVGETYRYIWKLSKEKNSTKVEVSAFFTKNKFLEKAAILFKNSGGVKTIIDELKSFNHELANSSKDYRWEQPILDVLPGQTCLCINISSRIEDKAKEMNENISFLSSYLPEGTPPPPLLYINELDLISQTLNFDFCYPVEEYISLDVEDSSIFISFKQEIRGEALAFYGNYSQTHRGWFSYMADRLGNKSPQLPFAEVFYDSPFAGIEQTNWKSKIYFQINK